MADISLSPDSENLKRCLGCKLSKPLSEFYKHKSRNFRPNPRCKDCERIVAGQKYVQNKEVMLATNRRWCARNKEKRAAGMRDYLFRKKYKMTIADHNKLLESQGFACAACNSPVPNNKTAGWNTDHCHKTGLVRGILCHHCNVGIGHAKDNIETLRKWIAYLERSSAPNDTDINA